jgi:hypothetical protein
MYYLKINGNKYNPSIVGYRDMIEFVRERGYPVDGNFITLAYSFLNELVELNRRYSNAK